MDQLEQKQPTFEDLELLVEVSQLLTLVDLDGVLQRVIQLAARAVGATKTSLFLHQEEGVDWDHIITMRSLSTDESIKVVSQVLDEGFAGWVFRNKHGDIISDTKDDPRWIIFPDDKVPVRSALCVPFMNDGKVTAVITLVHPEPNHFQPYHLRLVTIIANQAGIAMRNAQLVSHLRAQRQQHQAILQSMTDVLIVLDQYGQIIIVNDAALPLFNISEQEAVTGRNLADLEDRDKIFTPVIEIIEQASNEGLNEDHWAFEGRSEHSQKDFQVTMSVWKDGHEHRAYGFVLMMHDVTTLHDLHRFKDEMLQVASHDLRSPLALIVGYADMASIDTEDPTSPVHEYVDVIKKSVERMGGLIEDLLRVERIRSSPLELHEQIDLTALVKVVMVNMRPSATAKDQNLTAYLELEELPRIFADAVLIRQAMENLVVNAIKYTPVGGSIDVNAYWQDGRFYFSVRDNGIGIPENHQPYVFESFYRVSSAADTQKGSGLGLSLVKNVIMRHNGDVWLNSEPDQGSEFGFWLPLPTPEA